MSKIGGKQYEYLAEMLAKVIGYKKELPIQKTGLQDSETAG